MFLTDYASVDEGFTVVPLWLWPLIPPIYRFFDQNRSRVTPSEVVSYVMYVEYRADLMAELAEPEWPSAYWESIEEYRTEILDANA